MGDTRKAVKPEFIWVFDHNRRVYRDHKFGESSGGPIWREHWKKCEVTGETSRSWIIGRGYAEKKVPKANPDPRVFAFSEADIDRQQWVEEHKYKIIRAMDFVCDEATLRKIADLIHYVPKPEKR